MSILVLASQMSRGIRNGLYKTAAVRSRQDVCVAENAHDTLRQVDATFTISPTYLRDLGQRYGRAKDPNAEAHIGAALRRAAGMRVRGGG